MQINDLLIFIDSILKPLGFHKKGKAWYKDNTEIITIFALDRSRWSNQYYASLHFLLKGLSDEKRPIFYKTHSNYRAEGYMDHDPTISLNLENDMDDESRKRDIEKLISKSISILKFFETKKGIEELITLTKEPREIGIKMDARKYLGIEIP